MSCSITTNERLSFVVAYISQCVICNVKTALMVVEIHQMCVLLKGPQLSGEGLEEALTVLLYTSMLYKPLCSVIACSKP